MFSHFIYNFCFKKTKLLNNKCCRDEYSGGTNMDGFFYIVLEWFFANLGIIFFSDEVRSLLLLSLLGLLVLFFKEIFMKTIKLILTSIIIKFIFSPLIGFFSLIAIYLLYIIYIIYLIYKRSCLTSLFVNILIISLFWDSFFRIFDGYGFIDFFKPINNESFELIITARSIYFLDLFLINFIMSMSDFNISELVNEINNIISKLTSGGGPEPPQDPIFNNAMLSEIEESDIDPEHRFVFWYKDSYPIKVNYEENLLTIKDINISITELNSRILDHNKRIDMGSSDWDNIRNYINNNQKPLIDALTDICYRSYTPETLNLLIENLDKNDQYYDHKLNGTRLFYPTNIPELRHTLGWWTGHMISEFKLLNKAYNCIILNDSSDEDKLCYDIWQKRQIHGIEDDYIKLMGYEPFGRNSFIWDYTDKKSVWSWINWKSDLLCG